MDSSLSSIINYKKNLFKQWKWKSQTTKHDLRHNCNIITVKINFQCARKYLQIVGIWRTFRHMAFVQLRTYIFMMNTLEAVSFNQL